MTTREQEIRVVKRARERGMTNDQIQQVIKKLRGQSQPVETEQKGVLDRVDDVAAEAGQKFRSRIDRFAEATEKGEQTTAEQILQTGGALATGIGESVGGAAFEVAKEVTPEPIKNWLANSAQKVLQTEEVQSVVGVWSKFIDDLQTNEPRLARNLLATLEVGAGAVGGAEARGITTGVARTAVGAVETGANISSRATKGILSRVSDVSKAGVSRVGPIIEPTANIARRGAEKISGVVSQIPERISVASKTAKEASEALAKEAPSVKKAVSSGFSMKEASAVSKAIPEEKDIFRQMKKSADDLTSGNVDAKPPADIGGDVLNKIISSADDQRILIGDRLGEIAERFKGKLPDAKLNVLARLKKVNGLKRLKVDSKGNLDFSKTTLSTALTASDRKAINEFFKSIKGRDAFEQHQLRQEIFEVLGGRKKAKIDITDTQEKAFDAIRKGLADTLEGVSKDYKKVNLEYAKVAQPLKKLRRFYSGLENASPDILDEFSGILMRRLTGAGATGPKIRSIIEELKAVLGEAAPKVDLRKLQEFSNLLDKLYPEELLKGTGLANQVSLGIGKSFKGNLLERVAEKTVDVVAGSAKLTPEFQRKVLDELLAEIVE